MNYKKTGHIHAHTLSQTHTNIQLQNEFGVLYSEKLININKQDEHNFNARGYKCKKEEEEEEDPVISNLK